MARKSDKKTPVVLLLLIAGIIAGVFAATDQRQTLFTQAQSVACSTGGNPYVSHADLGSYRVIGKNAGGSIVLLLRVRAGTTENMLWRSQYQGYTIHTAEIMYDGDVTQKGGCWPGNLRGLEGVEEVYVRNQLSRPIVIGIYEREDSPFATGLFGEITIPNDGQRHRVEYLEQPPGTYSKIEAAFLE